jgi:ComF family protein
MLTFLDTVTGFIAPHECLGCGYEGDLLCKNCIQLLAQPVPRCYRCGRTDGGWQTCKGCRKHSPLENAVVATLYEGFAEALVRKLKFDRAYAAHTALARAMAPLISKDEVLVPIPTATNRVRQRGYDQSVLVANKLAAVTSSSCVPILERFGQQRQTGSGRKDRLTQLEGAFMVQSARLAGVDRVLLVDDVLTTGATFEVAAIALRRAGVRHVSALAFARAE